MIQIMLPPPSSLCTWPQLRAFVRAWPTHPHYTIAHSKPTTSNTINKFASAKPRYKPNTIPTHLHHVIIAIPLVSNTCDKASLHNPSVPVTPIISLLSSIDLEVEWCVTKTIEWVKGGGGSVWEKSWRVKGGGSQLWGWGISKTNNPTLPVSPFSPPVDWLEHVSMHHWADT